MYDKVLQKKKKFFKKKKKKKKKKKIYINIQKSLIF